MVLNRFRGGERERIHTNVFIAKKIVANLLAPLPFCLLVLLSGIFLLWATRRRKAGKILVTLGALLMLLFGYGVAPSALLKPLERKYAPISSVEGLGDVKYIVVLGGGSGVDPALPLSTFLSKESLFRLSEGVRLYNLLPQSKLIFTGGGFPGIVAVAEVMAETAREFGVAPGRIVVEPLARDTVEHPFYVEKIVNNERFILVTSAVHMPRAMAMFEKKGLHPVPAPTDFRVKQGEAVTPGSFFPGADSLENTRCAIHEYLGILWGRMLSQI